MTEGLDSKIQKFKQVRFRNFDLSLTANFFHCGGQPFHPATHGILR